MSGYRVNAAMVFTAMMLLETLRVSMSILLPSDLLYAKDMLATVGRVEVSDQWSVDWSVGLSVVRGGVVRGGGQWGGQGGGVLSDPEGKFVHPAAFRSALRQGRAGYCWPCRGQWSVA